MMYAGEWRGTRDNPHKRADLSEYNPVRWTTAWSTDMPSSCENGFPLESLGPGTSKEDGGGRADASTSRYHEPRFEHVHTIRYRQFRPAQGLAA
jgi:hypothetical protein